MNNIVHNKKGIAIYITFWIMSLLLGIALGISSILITQIHILRGIGESVFAFSATDAGIEHVLFIDTNQCEGIKKIDDRVQCLKDAIPVGDVVLSNGATYQLTIEKEKEGNCPKNVNYCARSVGSYKSARRAVRITR